MAVKVMLDALSAPQQGRVEDVVAALDPGSRTFTVKIALAGAMLRSGMFGRARFAPPSDLRDGSPVEVRP